MIAIWIIQEGLYGLREADPRAAGDPVVVVAETPVVTEAVLNAAWRPYSHRLQCGQVPQRLHRNPPVVLDSLDLGSVAVREGSWCIPGAVQTEDILYRPLIVLRFDDEEWRLEILRKTAC